MNDLKLLKKDKCSVKGCKNKAESLKDQKLYCDYHFQKVRKRQMRVEYWK